MNDLAKYSKKLHSIVGCQYSIASSSAVAWAPTARDSGIALTSIMGCLLNRVVSIEYSSGSPFVAVGLNVISAFGPSKIARGKVLPDSCDESRRRRSPGPSVIADRARTRAIRAVLREVRNLWDERRGRSSRA